MTINQFPIKTRTVDFQQIIDAKGYADLAQANANDAKVYASVGDLPAVTASDNGTWARVLVNSGVQAWLVVAGAWAFQAWLEGPHYDDVTALLASTDTFPAGTYIRTDAEGFAYKAVDTATATTVANAGGQAFEVLPSEDGSRSVDAFSAVGDGATDDAVPLQKALTVGGLTVFGPKTYITSAQLNLASDSHLSGAGWKSVLKITTADTVPLRASTKTGITIEDMGFYGVASTANNGAIHLVDSERVTVRRCEFENFSHRGVWCQGASTATKYVTVEDCYFHDWTATVVQDSCSVAFMAKTEYCSAINNICNDGGWHGVILQDNASDSGNTVIGHKVVGNNIGAHLAYGIATYELGSAPIGDSWHLIEGNTISEISGSVLSGASGGGIYLQGTGGVRVIGNRIYRTCLETTAETLVPAGIGVNGGAQQGDVIISNNHVEASSYYGIAVFSLGATSGKVSITSNVVSDCIKTGIYLKNSSKVSVVGNTVNQDGTATGNCIQTFDTGSAKRDGVAITGNSCFATNTRPLNISDLSGFVVSGNNIKIVSGAAVEGMNFADCEFGSITGNTVNGVVSDGHMLILSAATGTRVSGNIFRNSDPASRDLIRIAGTCTGTFVDSSNYLSSPLGVTNTSTGGNIEVRHTAAPAVKNWIVGDRAINLSPAVGSPVAWTCTTSGNPGTWTSEGNL